MLSFDLILQRQLAVITVDITEVSVNLLLSLLRMARSPFLVHDHVQDLVLSDLVNHPSSNLVHIKMLQGFIRQTDAMAGMGD